MTFVVTEHCARCRYTDCVAVCPVDCFHGDAEMLYIDPGECIDCGACVPECPVEAIFEEGTVPDDQRHWLAINAEKATRTLPVMKRQCAPLGTAASARKRSASSCSVPPNSAITHRARVEHARQETVAAAGREQAPSSWWSARCGEKAKVPQGSCKFRVGYELRYTCPAPTSMMLALNIHHSRLRPAAAGLDHDGPVRAGVRQYRDGFGNWCSRLIAPAGQAAHLHRDDRERHGRARRVCAQRSTIPTRRAAR